jgi:cytochrome c biogenesis protein CcmG/thiol:disulfide interchange protein DsbE
VVAVVLVAALFAYSRGSVAPVIGRGAVAPDFSLPSLDSPVPVSLAGLRGRIVLVNFWATWCKPCEEEMPAMERLYRTLRPAGFELLAISVDEPEAVVREFRDRIGVTFPILLDQGKSVATQWQTFAFPESLLVDRDGTILERYVGPREWDADAYVARLKRLLESETSR